MFLSKEQRILNELLKAKGKPVHMRVLNKICFSYGQRLHDLKNKGYKFDKMQVSPGEFIYWAIMPKARKSS
jgi:hypothetical protein